MRLSSTPPVSSPEPSAKRCCTVSRRGSSTADRRSNTNSRRKVRTRSSRRLGNSYRASPTRYPTTLGNSNRAPIHRPTRRRRRERQEIHGGSHGDQIGGIRRIG